MNKEGITAIIMAIIETSLENVRTLLEQPGIDLTLTVNKGQTALMCAIIIKNLEIIQSLIEYGDVNIHAIDSFDSSALMLAIKFPECIPLLMGAGADINQQNSRGQTALMFATQTCAIEAVDVLLAFGANPNIATYNHKISPLMSAAEQFCEENVRSLLKKGADPNQQDVDGDTALTYIVMMMKKAVGSCSRTTARSASACRRSHTTFAPIVQMMLNAGADATLKNAGGHSVVDVILRSPDDHPVLWEMIVPTLSRTMDRLQRFIKIVWEQCGNCRRFVIHDKKIQTIIREMLARYEDRRYDLLASVPGFDGLAATKTQEFCELMFNLVAAAKKSKEDQVSIIFSNTHTSDAYEFWKQIIDGCQPLKPKKKLQSIIAVYDKKRAQSIAVQERSRAIATLKQSLPKKLTRQRPDTRWKTKLTSMLHNHFTAFQKKITQTFPSLSFPSEPFYDTTAIPDEFILTEILPLSGRHQATRYRFLSRNDVESLQQQFRTKEWKLDAKDKIDLNPSGRTSVRIERRSVASPEFMWIHDILQIYSAMDKFIREIDASDDEDIFQFMKDTLSFYLNEIEETVETHLSHHHETSHPPYVQQQLSFQTMFPYATHQKKKMPDLSQQQLQDVNRQVQARRRYNIDIWKTSFMPLLQDVYRSIIVASRQYKLVAIVDVNNIGFELGVRDFHERNRLDEAHCALLIEILLHHKDYRMLFLKIDPAQILWVFVGQKDGRGIEFYRRGERYYVIYAGCVYRKSISQQQQNDCYAHPNQDRRMNPMDDLIIKNLYQFFIEKKEQTVKLKRRLDHLLQTLGKNYKALTTQSDQEIASIREELLVLKSIPWAVICSKDRFLDLKR